MADVIREYMVAVGFQTDQTGLRRFKDALRDLSAYVERHTTHPLFGIGSMFAKAGLMAAGALTAIDASIVGLMSRTARSDLDMQLFARRMFMSTEAARQMKTATDALGVSLEDVIWGPPELRERYRQLIEDQRRMGLGQDWEAQMRRIRDVQFQFTRGWVELQRFGMMFAGDLSKYLFGDQGSLEKNLAKLNEEFIQHMPEWADIMAKKVAPVIKSIAADTMAFFTDVHQFFDWLGSKQKASSILGQNQFTQLLDKQLNNETPSDEEKKSFWKGIWQKLKGGSWINVIASDAKKLGIPVGLALAIAEQESGMNPNAAVGSKGEIGMFQLMPDTIKSLRASGTILNPDDPTQNIWGGLNWLLSRPGATWADKIRAYNGAGPMAEAYRGDVLRRWQEYSNKGFPFGIPDFAPGATVQPQSFNPQITIHVQHLNATKDDLKDAVSEALKQAQTVRNKRLAIQFSEGYATNFVG